MSVKIINCKNTSCFSHLTSNNILNTTFRFLIRSQPTNGSSCTLIIFYLSYFISWFLKYFLSSLFAILKLEMTGQKHLASDRTYFPGDLSNSENSISCFEDSDNSDIDCNLSDFSRESDESEDNSLTIQNVRQWHKIDMKIIPSSPASFLFGGNKEIIVIKSINQCKYFGVF